MNIGIFTDSFTPEVNGVVTSLQLFIAVFRRHGHHVFIFAPSNDSKENAIEIDTRRYPSTLIFGSQVRLTLPLISERDVVALNLNIIHVNTPRPIGLAGTRLGKKLGIPLVYTYHTRVELYAHYYLHLPTWMEKGALALVAKNFYNRHDAIIAPSRGIKKELGQYVAKPIVVIPTGVDMAVNQALANKKLASKIFKKYNFKVTDNLLITASRLGSEKNIRFIIDAFVKIKKTVPNAKLIIVGDGPDKNSLKKYVDHVLDAKDVFFLGFLNHDKLFPLYKLAKVFLFSSQTETQGLVILEALSVGLPVVALAAVGVEDVMAGNAGGFMTKNSVDDFVKKIVELMSNRVLWKEKSQAANRRANFFSIEKMADKMIKLYLKLIKGA